MTQPHQTDLEELLHYQNAPDFIGPRLPTNHPAYRAYVTRTRPKPTPIPAFIAGIQASIDLARAKGVSNQDLRNLFNDALGMPRI